MGGMRRRSVFLVLTVAGLARGDLQRLCARRGDGRVRRERQLVRRHLAGQHRAHARRLAHVALLGREVVTQLAR